MYKILSVDDEPINQAIVEELLGTEFDVALASSGEECLEEIDTIQPELILMDVSMPGIDGYQTCRELKARPGSKNIPIIFVSARSTLEDKIKGYEAGGHDYITKPFNHADLETKIEQTITTLGKLSRNSENDTRNISEPGAHDSAAEMMRFPGDAGIITQFFEAIFSCYCTENLGLLLLDTLKYLKLSGIIQFRNASEMLNFSSNHAVSPLELSLIQQTLTKERFFDFNNRTIITYPHISLLIKNMPEENVGRYSELKDTLEIILHGVESRFMALLNEEAISSHHEHIFQRIKEKITEFEQHSSNLREKNIVQIKEYGRKVKEALDAFEDAESNQRHAACQEQLDAMTQELLGKITITFAAERTLDEKLRIIKDSIIKSNEKK